MSGETVVCPLFFFSPPVSIAIARRKPPAQVYLDARHDFAGVVADIHVRVPHEAVEVLTNIKQNSNIR